MQSQETQPHKLAIRFGLGAIKAVGFGMTENAVKERKSNGKFKDVYDFAERLDPRTINKKSIEALSKANVEVFGVLMMSALITPQELMEQAKIMEGYGANAIIIMDSTGTYLPFDVQQRISLLKSNLKIPVGFHAHNNLGVAISNASEAINSGAAIIDGASMGLGAGAGNAQLENIVSTGIRNNSLNAQIESFLVMSQLVENSYPEILPRTNSSSIQSGMVGVFSGYAPQVKLLSEELGIDVQTLWGEMAKRKLVAGQETMIREIAQDLMNL